MISSFIWKMAWRDSRSSRRRLLLFSISITLGIAALVGIGSFRHSLAQAIDNQARSLIGADLVVESTRKFRPEDEALLHSLGEPQAREIRFATMAVFPRSNGTRLVSIRALSGDFPFYGGMETIPVAAARNFRAGARAVVDESLLLQFHAQVGDPIKMPRTIGFHAIVVGIASGKNDCRTHGKIRCMATPRTAPAVAPTRPMAAV